jgi:putative oxidoreductase
MKLQEAIRFFVYPPTSGPKATLALRLMAGAVFFWEGLLKFAYANQGVGRFTKLGMPMPEVLAPAIAVLEIGGGLLLMSGLGTRLISVPTRCPRRPPRRSWEGGPCCMRFAPSTPRS